MRRVFRSSKRIAFRTRARAPIRLLVLVLPLALASEASRAQAGDADAESSAADLDAKPSVVIWPTLTPAGDAPSPVPLRRPPAADKELSERAQELDATLRDAAQDLGFTLYVADAEPSPGHMRDEDLIERAAHAVVAGLRPANEIGTWVVSPRIESAGSGQFLVRMIVVAPGAHELRVRVETVAGDAVSVRGLVMLRDMLSPQSAAQAAREQEREQAAKGSSLGIMTPLRSQGRAALAISSGLFGAFTAFALQRASGSDDPRVLYPLLALGTGVGVGGALLVADEWDVTTGDTGYLSAGAAWGAASGFLIAAGQRLQPFGDRYAWGIGSGLAGIGLATFALTRTSMTDGDATLAHSGGALGLLLGGAVDFLYRGSTATTPYTGMGYGSAIGLVAAGVLATQVDVSPSRVLLVDVGMGGGALLGAAAASPLIFQNQTQGNTRGWLSAAIGGSVVGGVLSWWLTREAPAARPAAAATSASLSAAIPAFGVLGTSPSRGGSMPVYGLQWSGHL